VLPGRADDSVGERDGHLLNEPGKRERQPRGCHEWNGERDRQQQAREGKPTRRLSVQIEGVVPDAGKPLIH
jgi:hypothetical protein